MKRYNLINNSLGWLCFLIASVTYLLTLEPTASFWDCPEFISQGFKLEVGHPPGNPIFMLAARFFVNFAGGDVTKVALMVNSMSALLSAGTILLLFWTVTHLAKRLLVQDDETAVSIPKTIVIMASGLCGALAYTWSDTFWFSAVEGEVYAFSSFCTALVFWLILKWENRADQPHSDRYLILIAYIIGISIAVHLLNLLCIPAIVLVIYYRKWKTVNVKGSLVSLLISFVIVALILFGLVPGFVEVAQYFELLFVNLFHCSYNVGVIVYAVLFVSAAVWSIYELYADRRPLAIRISFLLMTLMSGILFIGDSLLIPAALFVALAIYLFKAKKLPVRILAIASLSITVIFAGYSSYALLLIRSGANPPMNQNSPDNVFSLASYLSREQYGETPLLYGQQFTSTPIYTYVNDNNVKARLKQGRKLYGKVVKTDSTQRDQYIVTGTKDSYQWTPNTIFPRMYSRQHGPQYLDWIGATQADLKDVEISPYLDAEGNVLTNGWGEPIKMTVKTPSFAQNLRYFINYQLNHMYFRYFLWNFAGRQNDLQGNGELNRGNWITGIAPLDNLRLGDQSLLPYEQGEGNAGHNVFYMLPLLLGIIGLLWQAFHSKRGIEQFWVVFFLFFMTGIAIVLYLNQPPSQPRERDYAFAGSFYAYAIWIGLGVAAIANILASYMKKNRNAEKIAAAVAVVIGLAIPLQMVSQTWDDHDRSGRYTARDFGMNYLSSLAPDAIIFTNGDNDTFPLWYAQEVEDYRTDVRVVNLSYLTTDWYANQMKLPTYHAAAIDMLATPEAYTYDRLQFNYIDSEDPSHKVPVEVLASLGELYRNAPKTADNQATWNSANMYIPIDAQTAINAGIVSESDSASILPYIPVNLVEDHYTAQDRGASLGKVLSLDMLATSVKNGWNRPIYFAMTVPEDYYLGLSPYMRNTGLTYQVVPLQNQYGDEPAVDAETMYKNVTEKFRWGGLPEAAEADRPLYLDETVRKMVTTHRSALIDLAVELYNQGIEAKYVEDSDEINPEGVGIANDKFRKSADILNIIMEKLPVRYAPLGVQIGEQIGNLYVSLGKETNDEELKGKGLQLLHDEIERYAEIARYVQYQSRIGNGGLLSRIDRYAPTYLVRLIQTYYVGGGNIEELEKELMISGVDINQLGA
ncbi:MAG: DUF2723 domain-containing protein [Muribaculaceae bacterium]|nr:DUF2723 domain-containing protein [Muribaculaceae bacterium]